MTGGKLPAAGDIRDAVVRALAEDIGPGDVTAALVPQALTARGAVVCREQAVLCGAAWFEGVFKHLDPGVEVAWRLGDGDAIAAGQIVCSLLGPARALLSGERVALNFLQTLSGTATESRRYAEAVRGYSAKVFDTRKTLPGLRAMQKYAVVCGGCHNHRHGLYDAILIKENHIAVLGSVRAAVEAARAAYPRMTIEIEVESPAQLHQAVEAGADIVLLDNFAREELSRAVALNAGRAQLEVSGGVSLDAVREIAATGVDRISVGALTKNVRAADFSMRIDIV